MINNFYVTRILQLSIVLFFGLSLFGWSGCVEESKFLSRAEKKHVDTTVLNMTKVLRVQLDSICNADFEENVNQIVDSVLEVRIREIKSILEQ